MVNTQRFFTLTVAMSDIRWLTHTDPHAIARTAECVTGVVVMQADHKTWIKIGEEQKRHKLQDAVQNIERKWPNRFDFRITPAATQDKQHAASFGLYLKHR